MEARHACLVDKDIVAILQGQELTFCALSSHTGLKIIDHRRLTEVVQEWSFPRCTIHERGDIRSFEWIKVGCPQ